MYTNQSLSARSFFVLKYLAEMRYFLLLLFTHHHLQFLFIG